MEETTTPTLSNLSQKQKEYLAGLLVSGLSKVTDTDSYNVSVPTRNIAELKDLIELLVDNRTREVVDNDRTVFKVTKSVLDTLEPIFNAVLEGTQTPSESFARGVFENVGVVSEISNQRLVTVLKFFSDPELNAKLEECWLTNFKGFFKTEDRLASMDNNAFDFLGKLYDEPVCSTNNAECVYVGYYKNAFMLWGGFVPMSSITNFRSNQDGTLTPLNHVLSFLYAKARPDAVAPFKTRVSDSGYDLTLLEKVKTVGDVEYYDTGLKVQPSFGWYFDVVPRSSLSKTGYVLANSTGVIDRTYTGTILVPLRKVDKSAPDIKTPVVLVQMVPRPVVHMSGFEVPEEQLTPTERGAGGFGSTNKS